MPGLSLQQSGEVVSAKDGILTVRVERAGGCSSCRQKAGCAQGVLAAGESAKVRLPMALVAVSGLNLTGPEVGLSMSAGALSRIIALNYLLIPLLLVAGAWIGTLISPTDFAALCGSIAGLGLGCLVLRLYHATGLAAGSLRSLSVGPRSGAVFTDQR